MQTFETDAINLNSYELNEYDKIMLLYTKERGLLRAVAKGSKRPRSKFSGSMDSLVANELFLVRGKNLDIISQAKSINSFHKLRNNFEGLCYAMYCCELVANFGIEDDPNAGEIYTLLYQVLKSISAYVEIEKILLNVIMFQLKLLKISGIGIQLDCCINCARSVKEESELLYSINDSGVICSECIDKGRNRVGINIDRMIRVNKKLRNFFEYLVEIDIERESNKYIDKVTERFCKRCFEFLKKYIEIHSEKRFKTLKVLEVLN